MVIQISEGINGAQRPTLCGLLATETGEPKLGK